MSTHPSRPRAALLAPVVLVATALLAWVQWRGVAKGIWVDSDVYIMGARTLLDGGDLYAGASAVDLRFTYSPFAAAMFVPLALLPAEAARWTLTGGSLVALLVTLLVVGRRLKVRPWVMCWLVIAAAALEPVFRNLLLGQINLILMGIVVVDALVVPQRYRGFLVGIAAGIKLTPAVFVVYFLLQRDWRSAARAGTGFAASVLLGLVVAPSSSLSFWSGGFIGLGKFGADAVVGTDNQSLLAALLRVAGRSEVPLSLQLLLAIAGVALGALAARRSLTHGGPAAHVEALAWIALGGLLGSPISWTHHWVWIIVVLAVFASRREGVKAALVLILFWFPTVWLLYTAKDFEELTFPWWKALISAVYVILGVVMLLSEVLRKPPSSRGMGAPEQEPATADRPAKPAPTSA